MAKAADKVSKSRSGTQWSDADYATRGYGRLSLRLSTDVLDMLAAKAEAAGCSRAELVGSAVRAYKTPKD